ncbi:RING finger and CHY zinc finger domain-containing protein 1-like [Styela clava]
MSDIGNNSHTETESEICTHYIRRCLLECSTCWKFYPCRLCHDEKCNHKLNRYLVKHIKCNNCSTVQEVSPECKVCSTNFGKYHCSICNMFDDRDRKQYHCDDCGLCRVGGRANFFHCAKCDLCLSIDIKDSHKCVEKSSKSNCPVCLEDMHTSTESLKVPSCGHLIHQKCYSVMLQHNEYRCPSCGKSTLEMSKVWENLDEEIAVTPMPDEYANTLIWILCKDCQGVSNVRFHVLGLKCSKCKSYNTCGTGQPQSKLLETEEPHT